MITERPWKYSDTMIVDTEGFTIARSGHVHDAAHIVRCVNHHQALVEALQNLIQANKDSFGGIAQWSNLFDDAEAALAAAEQEAS